MKSKFSTRLIFWHSSILFLALMIFGYLSYYFISHQLYSEQFASLAENSEKISEVFRMKKGFLDMDYLQNAVEELNLSESGVFFEVWDSKQNMIFRSPNFPVKLNTPIPISENGRQLSLTELGGITYHLYETSVNVYSHKNSHNELYYIHTGQSIIYIERILHKIRVLLLLLVPIILLFAGSGGWYLTKQALKPIADITNTARDISLYHLNHRLPLPNSDDELSQLVKTLNSMFDRIEKGVQNIQQFTADASHELRTPITAMRGEIEVSLRRSRSEGEYVEVLHSSLQELQWMEKMINDLLLLSRADAGELQLKLEQCDLVELIKDCYQTQNISAQKKNISIKLSLSDEEIDAYIDSYRMKQIICNLLDNAVKYTQNDGKISICAENYKKGIRITISDNGRGIAEEELPLIFNRFYRADKSRSIETYSSGLGLSICKWIVEAHNGKIEINSRVGEGTVATVTLS
jgi:heavy metal sensor kinase